MSLGCRKDSAPQKMYVVKYVKVNFGYRDIMLSNFVMATIKLFGGIESRVAISPSQIVCKQFGLLY